MLFPNQLDWYWETEAAPLRAPVDRTGGQLFAYDPYSYFMVVATRRCNTTCDYCFRDPSGVLRDELDFDEFAGLVDFFAARAGRERVLQLTGGEIFVRPDIHSWLNYALNHDFRVWVTTNGLHPPHRR